jgi:hypothetical protein
VKLVIFGIRRSGMKTLLPQPKEIKTAEKLLYLTIAIMLVGFVIARFVGKIPVYTKEFQFYIDMNSIMAITTQVVTIAIIVFLIFKILSGKNWARIVYLIFTIFGLLQAANNPQSAFYFKSIFNYGYINAISNILNILSIVLSVAILFFLFNKNSNAWYRDTKKLRK